jgi:flagellar basal-body rod modification protein FlgD
MQSTQQIVTSVPQVANSSSAVANAMAKPRVASAGGSSGSQNTPGTSSTSTDTTITANDFLTLLVAEMKNQDPTQPTDPNAYISQMVQVNSLQQLIGINQGITTLDTATGASSNPSANATTGVGPSQ